MMVVAPSGDDAQAVGVRARVELAHLACRLTPPAILVAGDAILKKALRSITSGSGGEIAVRGCVRRWARPTPICALSWPRASASAPARDTAEVARGRVGASRSRNCRGLKDFRGLEIVMGQTMND
jgi:hypothetical protein